MLLSDGILAHVADPTRAVLTITISNTASALSETMAEPLGWRAAVEGAIRSSPLVRWDREGSQCRPDGGAPLREVWGPHDLRMETLDS
mmetsp:Transcript_25784/g.72181  ORF Transcript_25784/g.72181 Transcript_25784/m.72181 type:complete len:88 (+) Transcript_25784:1177-1440(+)